MSAHKWHLCVAFLLFATLAVLAHATRFAPRSAWPVRMLTQAELGALSGGALLL